MQGLMPCILGDIWEEQIVVQTAKDVEDQTFKESPPT